jgi:hypothetical protein
MIDDDASTIRAEHGRLLLPFDSKTNSEMRRRWFIGMSQEWLEARLLEARQDLASGTTNIGGTAGDSAFTELQNWSPTERIDALLYELSIVDPDTYPPADVVGKRVTKGVFWPSC